MRPWGHSHCGQACDLHRSVRAAAAHAAELEQVRSDAARERAELHDALEFRARILEESRDELRGRAERAERELDRLRQGTGGGQNPPVPPARRRGRQGKTTEDGQ